MGGRAYNQDAFERYSPDAENIIRAGFRPREGWIASTQKPLALMEALIELTTQRQLVLDPFAGSGTTGVAAKALAATI